MLSLALASLLSAAPMLPTAQEESAAATINARELLAHTRFLSSDLLEGRGPGMLGDQLTQQYIATQFEALGLAPGAADGTWFQRFDLVGVTSSPKTLTVTAGPQKSLTLEFHDEFIGVAGTQVTETNLAAAELVFVGYGIQAPEFQWDDYKGLDVKGKVLLMMNSDPAGDPNLFAGKTRLWYGRWDYKYEIAARLGAAGAIVIHTTESAGYPFQVVQTSWTGEQFDIPPQGQGMQLRAWTTEDATRKIVALAGHDLDKLRASAETRDFEPVALGVKVGSSFTSTIRTIQTANVLGLIKGSDPKLSQQMVIVTAHHDHIGKSASARPGEDAIYNGALDNASGIAQLIGVAKAFTRLPKAPRRSVLFAAVAAEEAGLLGSEYLAKNPPVPPGRIAINVNMDGANIWGRTKDVSVIGWGKSNVDQILEPIAKMQGRKIKPDTMPDRGFFYRSDQFNFAKLGVPAAYADSGDEFIGKPPGWGRKAREEFEAKHYHQPSDEITADWNLDGAVEDAQMNFYLAAIVARREKMPEWNKGDEFEAPRKRSLEALDNR